MRLQITRQYELEPEENKRQPFALTFQLFLTPAEEALLARCGDVNPSGVWSVDDLRKGLTRRYGSAQQALADEPLARAACDALMAHLRDVKAWHGSNIYEFALDDSSTGSHR